MTKLIPLHLRISSAFLVVGDRPILVDTGKPKDFDAIVWLLAKEKVTPHDLALILHTHGHQDHCGSSDQLKRVSSAPLAIHPLDAFMPRQGRNGPLTPRCLLARLLMPFLNSPFPSFEPDLLLDQEMPLRDYGVDGRIVFTPGHTAGLISVVLDTGEAICGDLLRGGYLGGAICRARPGYPYVADDLPQVRASVRKVLDLKPTKIYVGHGGPFDPASAARWLDQTEA